MAMGGRGNLAEESVGQLAVIARVSRLQPSPRRIRSSSPDISVNDTRSVLPKFKVLSLKRLC